MKYIVGFLLLITSFKNYAGSLYKLDYHDALVASQSKIQAYFPVLAKTELRFLYMKPEFFGKNKELLVKAFYSYKADNKFGVLFVCSKIDENGNLVNIEKDIEPKKGFYNSGVPVKNECTGRIK